MQEIAKQIIFVGIVLIFAGGVLYIFGKFPWAGKLPGDIHIKKDQFSFYFPLTTCILLSLLISFILYLLNHK